MYGDAKSAVEWEKLHRDSEKLYRGEHGSGVRKAQALIDNPRSFRAWRALGQKSLRGPVRQS